MRFFLSIAFITLTTTAALAQEPRARLVKVDSGWAKTSVNSPIFRKNSLVSFHDRQYIAYYNKDGFVVLGKRKINDDKWELKQTSFKGNVADAHNAISIMVDGDGYLHMAWDHHNNRLHYARSKEPGSLEMMNEMAMTGKQENKLSYPEFYKMTNGNLLFLYRDGGSGNGSLVMNRYDTKFKTWTQLHSNLINGEGQRNAYWQACIDNKGIIHISWVWRESADVASNHDLAYACSKDGGITWEKSTGEKYQLPITANSAEYAWRIPQKSELINQTSMFADNEGNPYIATYWREEGSAIPQYHIVYRSGGEWKKEILDFRKTPFSLNGAGSKQIPISRPQIIAWNSGKSLLAVMIFRDVERGSKVTAAINSNIGKKKWKIVDLTRETVGSWEPSYDTELWKDKGILHLFVENVEQVDGEGMGKMAPQMVQVLEWEPKKFFK